MHSLYILTHIRSCVFWRAYSHYSTLFF